MKAIREGNKDSRGERGIDILRGKLRKLLKENT